ncbi:efflux RND transporter periplasmic adaptor subunit [uncultured Tateyamaria sp.]|uniref:efflux RND transporter periplasmic adaptor subunit n=1 Tax=uncultured Tateyamaria sp. TaxID=455651 RepID=UPI00260E314F|nr:efflux RND transporter periplasmic adaptor subunit [uncultured Tateyamaria sp.]
MIRALVLALVLATPVAAQETVSAILEPAQQIDVRVSVAGRIAEIAVIEGAEVAAGALVLSIDSAVQQARVKLARLAAEATGPLQRAQTSLAQAGTMKDRIARANARGAAQAWEVTQSEQNVLLAEADLLATEESRARAVAQLELERATLSEFSVMAPFDATVLEIFAEPGETVDTQTVLITLGRLDQLVATAFVPLDWVSGLIQGDRLNVTLDDDTQREVALTFIDPRVDPASRTVRIKLQLANADRALRVGTGLVLRRP